MVQVEKREETGENEEKMSGNIVHQAVFMKIVHVLELAKLKTNFAHEKELPVFVINESPILAQSLYISFSSSTQKS